MLLLAMIFVRCPALLTSATPFLALPISDIKCLSSPRLPLSLCSLRFSEEKGDFTDCVMDGSESDGGLYEVCVVQMPWLVGNPGQEVRQNRCMTTANAELEPWMFAFTKI